MNVLNLEITALAYGGAGIGRHEGKVCFVPRTAPGDVVIAGISREKKGYCECELVEILTPSPDRTDPVCPLFGSCGGCSWQHLSYRAQVRAKEDILRQILQRVDPSAECLPCCASPLATGYRSRIQLKLRSTDTGLAIGFYRKGSHFVIDIADSCPLASSTINAVLPSLRSVLSAFADRDRIPQVDVVHGDDGLLHLTFHALSDAAHTLAPHLLERISLFPENLGGLHLQAGRKETLRTVWGGNELFYQVPGVAEGQLRLSFSCGGFSQVNSGVNRLLISEIASLAAQGGGRGGLLDLCCGNGNLSLPLAPLFSGIDGIEGYTPSILSAEKNAQANGILHARFHAGAAENFASFLAGDDEYSLVLLDPPREGARMAVERLAASAFRRIFYISCDPSTLARDAAHLCRSGYRLTSFRGFDMFPQTYHIETLATFALQS